MAEHMVIKSVIGPGTTQISPPGLTDQDTLSSLLCHNASLYGSHFKGLYGVTDALETPQTSTLFCKGYV